MEARTEKLTLALGALVVFQVLHLLDELRTEESADGLAALVAPEVFLAVAATVAAFYGVRRGTTWGRPLAVVTAVLVALGFAVVHGLPTANERTEPYWGDGSADVLQWAGVLAIWAACAAVVALSRPGMTVSEASPA